MIDFDDFYKLDNIVMNVANECPLRCSYCYAHKMKGLMSNDLAEKILDKCYKNHLEKGSKQKFNVSFYGGEPLLNWDCIKHSLEYCKEKQYDIDFGITTNLVILTDEMIEYFKEYDVGLLVSLDGSKEIHDENRCNSYDKVSQNIKKLLEKGLKKNIRIRMTITPQCCKKLWKNIKSIIDFGINIIESVLVTDMEWSEDDYNNLKNGLREVWDEVLNSYYTRNPYKIKFVEDYIDKDLWIGNKSQQEVCNAGSCYNCSIGVNGEIMPCHQRHLIPDNFDKLLLGNIWEDLVKIREDSFNTFTRKSNFYSCESCCAKSVCKGGCPSENLTENGDANIMNKQQCKIQQILYEVAFDRIKMWMWIDENIKLPPFIKKVVKNNMILLLMKQGFVENLDEIERLIKSLKEKDIFNCVRKTFEEQKELALKNH